MDGGWGYSGLIQEQRYCHPAIEGAQAWTESKNL